MTHHFKFLQDSTRPKSKKKFKQWLCAKCNSVVEYEAILTETDINKKMDLVPSFPCIKYQGPIAN